MADRIIRARGDAAELLRSGIATIQQQLGVTPDFPDPVERAADAAAARAPLPELDRTDLDFVTLDPEGSMDLDQAMHLARDGSGYVVHYAIADVAAFVRPGDPVDDEAHSRGETLYGADSVIPLHPRVLSEGAASLLPDQLRPAFVWTVRLDGEGEIVGAEVVRARVRSRARLDYESVHRALGDGSAPPMMSLLGEIGRLRLAREVERGGVNLPMPEQEVVVEGGEVHLRYREVRPVETWNAQVSLLTGFAAAAMMLHGRVGILRTLPPPAAEVVKRLHRTAAGLGLTWPAEQLYPDFIRTLDPRDPAAAAMTVACTALLRGAGYVGFDGETPEQPEHAALASEYAHVTAPLRRLADRYALEVCAALSAGVPVPDWVLEKLHDLPDTMRASDRRAHQYESEIVNLAEATALQTQVGAEFTGVVLEVDHDHADRGQLMVREPAIEASVTGPDLPVGEQVRVRLDQADPVARTVHFTRVAPEATGAGGPSAG